MRVFKSNTLYSSVTGLTTMGSIVILSSLLHITSVQHSHQQIAHPNNSISKNITINIASYDISIYLLIIY